MAMTKSCSTLLEVLGERCSCQAISLRGQEKAEGDDWGYCWLIEDTDFFLWGRSHQTQSLVLTQNALFWSMYSQQRLFLLPLSSFSIQTMEKGCRENGKSLHPHLIARGSLPRPCTDNADFPSSWQQTRRLFSLLLTEKCLHVPDIIIIICFTKLNKTRSHAEELHQHRNCRDDSVRSPDRTGPGACVVLEAPLGGAPRSLLHHTSVCTPMACQEEILRYFGERSTQRLQHKIHWSFVGKTTCATVSTRLNVFLFPCPQGRFVKKSFVKVYSSPHLEITTVIMYSDHTQHIHSTLWSNIYQVLSNYKTFQGRECTLLQRL